MMKCILIGGFMNNNTIIIIICFILITILIKGTYNYLKIKPYKNQMVNNKDFSKILYWNNHNILLTEKNIYINKEIYSYKDIVKIIKKTKIINYFIYTSPRSIFKSPAPFKYYIYLNNKNIIEIDDSLHYYKDIFISIVDIIKEHNNDVLVDEE